MILDLLFCVVGRPRRRTGGYDQCNRDFRNTGPEGHRSWVCYVLVRRVFI
jgi:hypothetical protein